MSASPPNGNNELLESLLGEFLDESDQLLTQLNENLLQLDEWVQSLDDNHQQRCDESLLNDMFRAAHSLKGLSAMLGLSDINQLTHKIENVFDAARHGQLTVTREVTELMFQGLDHLVALVGLLKEPGRDPVSCDGIMEAIRGLLQRAHVERGQATQAEAEQALAAVAGERGEAPQSCPMAAAAGEADPLQGIADEQEIPGHYLSLFADEAETSLDALTSGLLALEAGGSADGLKALLGIAHKLKGSAASIGLNRVARMAHLMEDVFENLLAANGVLAPPQADVLLRCADALQQFVAQRKAGRSGPDRLADLARELLAAQGAPSQASTAYAGEVAFQPGLPSAGLKAALIYEKLAKLGEVQDCQPPPEKLDAIDTLPSFRFRLTTGKSRDAVAAQLRIGGVLRVTLEPLGGAADPPGNLPTGGTGPDPAGGKPEQALPAARDIPEAAQPASPPAGGWTQGAPGRPAAPEAAGPREPEPPNRPGRTSQRAAETIRVDTDRLDQLMDLAGQLVINRARFSQISEKLKAVTDCSHLLHAFNRVSVDLERLTDRDAVRYDGQHGLPELERVRGHIRRIRDDLEPLRREIQALGRSRDSLRELFEAVHQLDRVSGAIQKSVMGVRMVPVGPLFARFHRVVRDIARATGKQIRLEVAGEKTELDKRMIDELGDPLVHLVRNSADHGIELPAEREAAGKPRQGIVALEAYHRGNSIVIEVRDDGRGLKTDRILRKALDKGLVSEAEAARMTPCEVQQLIWMPGLSTAEKVTDVSGRGMGMDIVKTKIEELTGTVEVQSMPGTGTTITIKLPLTLAILPCLMVQLAGDVFAIPMEAVTEIVCLRQEQVRTVHGQPMGTVRGRVVSLVQLNDVLGFHRVGATSAERPPAETTLVILRDRGREIGLAVDRVIGEDDVVIKSVAENYRNVRGIAGAGILGDGRVALILDIPVLIGTLSRKASHSSCTGTLR